MKILNNNTPLTFIMIQLIINYLINYEEVKLI